MGSFGDRLRREREMRGISLEEIATATKISSRNLRALEEEKFNQLPGGIFNKGFVRAYAKFLGIDEEQMVAEYVSASSETEAAREQKLKSDLSKVEFKRDDEDQREILLEPKSQWGTIAVIVLMAVAAFGGYEYYQKRKAERQHQAQVPPPVVTTQTASVPTTPVQTSAPATTPQAPAPTTNATASGQLLAAPSTTSSDKTGSASAQTQPPPQIEPPKPASQKAATELPTTASKKPAEMQSSPSGPIDVKIHAKQDSWVSITADGKTIMKGTLAAASERAVRAKEQVVVVLGNAGGVEVSYNGKTLENLGKGQEVKKLTFTASGYQ
ncbi:MAG: RodZ domain-containing protein [Terriglobales bacterium]